MRNVVLASFVAAALLSTGAALADGAGNAKRPQVQLADGAGNAKRPQIQLADGAGNAKRPQILV